jgi:hypothetical protein
VYPDHMLGGVVYGPNFTARRPDQGRGFMVAYVRAVRDYIDSIVDGRTNDEIISLLAQYSAVKDRAILERMVLPGFRSDPFVNRDSVARDLEAYLRWGSVTERVPLDRVIDDQFVQYAVDKLGRRQ